MKRWTAGAGRGLVPVFAGLALLACLTSGVPAQDATYGFSLSGEIADAVEQADEVFAQRVVQLLDEREARIAAIVESAVSQRVAELERRLAEKELEIALKEKQISDLQQRLDEMAFREWPEEPPVSPGPTDAFLGVDHVDSEEGAMVVRVLEGTPAADHGLRVGDCITAIEDEEITSETLGRVITRHAPGAWVTVRILRDGEQQTVWLALMDRSDFRETPVASADAIDEIFEEVTDPQELPEASREIAEPSPASPMEEEPFEDDGLGRSDAAESYDHEYEYDYEYDSQEYTLDDEEEPLDYENDHEYDSEEYTLDDEGDPLEESLGETAAEKSEADLPGETPEVVSDVEETDAETDDASSIPVVDPDYRGEDWYTLPERYTTPGLEDEASSSDGFGENDQEITESAPPAGVEESDAFEARPEPAMATEPAGIEPAAAEASPCEEQPFDAAGGEGFADSPAEAADDEPPAIQHESHDCAPAE